MYTLPEQYLHAVALKEGRRSFLCNAALAAVQPDCPLKRFWDRHRSAVLPERGIPPHAHTVVQDDEVAYMLEFLSAEPMVFRDASFAALACRDSGFKRFSCNLQLVGQLRGEGGVWSVTAFKDKAGNRCAYHATVVLTAFGTGKPVSRQKSVLPLVRKSFSGR
jgi:hypothetical protein